MKTGKERIYHLPVNDITNLGAFAAQVQREAELRGERLPPPLRSRWFRGHRCLHLVEEAAVNDLAVVR